MKDGAPRLCRGAPISLLELGYPIFSQERREETHGVPSYIGGQLVGESCAPIRLMVLSRRGVDLEMVG